MSINPFLILRPTLFVIAILLSQNVWAEDNIAQKRVDKIKNSYDQYFFGQGQAATISEADAIALKELGRNISTKISSTYKEKLTHETEEMEMNTSITSLVSLGPTEQIILRDEPDAIVFRYVLRSEVKSQVDHLTEKIEEYIAEGLHQEERLSIASALRYYNWAYAIADIHPEPVKVKIDGKPVTAKVWLQAHIENLLKDVVITLDKVIEQPGSLDPYLVTLNFKYANYPVGELDFAYFNGLKRVENMHANNGQSTLAFPELPKNIDIQFKFKYEEEGSRLDDDLSHIFALKPTPNFPQANHNIACSGTNLKKFKTGKDNVAGDKSSQTANLNAGVKIAPSRPQTSDRKAMGDAEASPLVAKIEKIKRAIASKNYSSAKDCFTEDGYSLFMQMMGSVNNKNRKGAVVLSQGVDEPITVEQSGNFIVAKDIPVQLQYASGDKVNERIILRFSDTGLVQSVAFALSQRAEEDIFRDNKWGLDVRYAIKQFMEDYQTAFALKRLDYIKSIFSDDAIIITGKRNPNRVSAKAQGENGINSVGSGYVYSTYTKDEYMNQLQVDFRNKKYIQLKFEDNEISSVGGMFENIYWIQLKQFYNSSSYSDIGYLALMIDMRTENPQIKVRTWLPDKFDIDNLKRTFPIE